MQIIRKSSFTATPWKNGGGITHEAIRVPATGNTFRWRVSVAQVDASGPFSDFPDYNRKMVLLRGAGVRLTFDGHREAYLREVGDLAEFDGALPTHCDLLDGPCTDLNLMVSKSMAGVVARVLPLDQPRTLPPNHGTTLVFAIRGVLSVESAGEDSVLDPWDLAVMSPEDSGVVRPAVPDQSPAPLVFLAALDDNSP